MRALPDLTDLPESPSVFTQGKDDWNSIFASEFQGMAAEQAGADQQSTAAYAGMDPISQSIDALGSALYAAGSVLDLLSGDLDAVNLDPIINDFQTQDAALESNLSGFTLDYNTISAGLFSDIYNLASEIVQVTISAFREVIAAIESTINYILQELTFLDNSIGGGLG